MEWRVLDLFSGIGGFSLGLERAGMRTVAFCEIDPRCRRVLKRHWPNVPQSEDVTKRAFVEGEADVITAGFPCQDVSSIGLRAGITGERSGLYREVIRALRVVRPKYAIMENVAALLADGMGDVLRDLASIGYDAEWHCISAESIGAPHQRDRVWIIAYATNESRFHKPYSGKIEERLSDYRNTWSAGSWDEASPRICRMDDGISDRVDRTSELGNSVVPQIPEIIGRAIIAAESDNELR